MRAPVTVVSGVFALKSSGRAIDIKGERERERDGQPLKLKNADAATVFRQKDAATDYYSTTPPSQLTEVSCLSWDNLHVWLCFG